MKKEVAAGLFVMMIMALSLVAQHSTTIYSMGEGGYACFRIPSIITTRKGTLLAFAEGRRVNCGDAGDIDLVVKRSGDGGRSWSGLQLVWSDSNNTCGNPAPVVDQKTGKILLLTTWNLGSDHEKDIIAGTSKDTRRVFLLSSSDDGLHWSIPAEITADVKLNNWTWYATGPGRGIQVTKGKFRGRLVVPANHITADAKQNFSHVIYSDDGERWSLGGTTTQDSVNESTVAQLSNGRLMLNMRNASKKRFRQIAISRNGGKSWSDIHADSSLIEPVCEGNLLRYNFRGRKNTLLFTNPASQTLRERLTIRVSFDNGKTWPLKKLLYAGPSAYSCMTILPNGNIGCFYEAGVLKPYERLTYQELRIEDLSTKN